MKNLQGKLLKKSFVFVFILGLVAPISALAGTGTYNSTYDFTGGLYSTYLNMNSNRDVTVYTYPNLSKTDSSAEQIYVELRKKGFLADSIIDYSWTYARKNDQCIVTTKDAGDYRFYFRGTVGGVRHAGDITIKY